MTTLNDGGPAFPYRCSTGIGADDTVHFATGMSLRQFYAAMAMQGLASATMNGDGDTPADWDWKLMSKTAFGMADALLRTEHADAMQADLHT